MDKDIRNLMVASVLGGIIANKEICRNDEDFNDFIDNYIVMANKCVDKILSNEENRHDISKRAQTGILDATGKQILDGDIIVYTKWWSAKDLQNKDKILAELIDNYKKYKEKISLHPVFWDDDLHIYCTDTHSDADPLYKIDTQYVYIVSNKIDHPELYNY